MEKVDGKIYKVTNKVDGKIYVGQTIQGLNKRWRAHCRSDNGKNSQSYLFRAIEKHGESNFTLEQIDSSSTLEGLNMLEEMYIKKFNSLAPEGYNLESGGDNHRCHEDTKKKLSIANKGKPIKDRWDKGFVGNHTEETKEKIRKKLKGSFQGERWDKGNSTPRSDEMKKRISDTMTGVAQPWKYKKVVCVETGEGYESVNAAAEATGIKRPTLSLLLKSGGTNRKTGRSFRFL